MNRPVARVYSRNEALGFVDSLGAYCDRIRADFPDADLGSLEAYAAAFRLFLETCPSDLEYLRALCLALRRAEEIEGTDRLHMLSYIEEYAQFQERTAAGE